MRVSLLAVAALVAAAGSGYGGQNGGMTNASGQSAQQASAYATPASLGQQGGSRTSYFHLSDLNMPVQIKM